MKTFYSDPIETSPFWNNSTASTPAELDEFSFNEFKMPF